MRLNLGSGSEPKEEGVVNVDISPHENVHVVHDLDSIPWPFAGGTVEQIVAQDIFEHVDNPIGFMTEAHRVLEPGGSLVIKTPHYKSADAFTDPTHRRHCTVHSWDYWIPGTALYTRHNPAYGGVAFAMVNRELVNGAIFIGLRKIESA